jgi:putative addiction module killer protein
MVEMRKAARFTEWFDALRESTTKAGVRTRIFPLQQGGPGDHRARGGGVFELKLDYGPGYGI